MQHFCCEKAAFFKFFGLYLDLDFPFEKLFWTVVGLGLSFKKLVWIWIAKYDSPLISDTEQGFKQRKGSSVKLTQF